MAAGRIKGITIEIGGDTTKLTSALAKVDNALGKTKTNLRDLDRALKLNPGNTALLKDKQEELAHAISESKSKLETEKEALAQLAQADQTPQVKEQMRQLQVQIDLDTEALKALENEAKQSASVLGSQFQAAGDKIKEVGENIKGVGDKIAGIGKDVTAKVTTPIVGAFGAAVKTTMDFDSQMSKVSAISGATGEDFQALRDKAREMGADTKYSATEAAEAFEYMGMAGWKTDQMMAGIPGILNLAAASGEELGTTSDIVTDALTAFGMGAEDASRFADILAAASTNANTNVSMMGESFKYVAPVAGSLGYSAEDVSVALGLMANSGIKASQAGTSLRNMFQRMAKPTKESQAAMDRLGISLADGEGNMYSFRDIMGQLRESFANINMPAEEYEKILDNLDSQLESGDMTQSKYNSALEELNKQAFGAEGAEKARAAAMLGGARAMSGLLAIANASEEDFDKLTSAIDNSSDSFAKLEDGSIVPLNEALESGQRIMETYEGTAAAMAATMQDNLGGDITTLKSKLEELAISFGDLLTPALRDITDYVKAFVDKLNEMDPAQKEQITKIALIVAAIGPVLLIIGKVIGAIGAIVGAIGTVTSIIGTLMTSIGGLSGAIALLTSPVTIVIAAIAALVAAFVYFYNTNEEFRNKVNETIETVKAIISAFIEAIKIWLNEHQAEIQAVMTAIKTIISTVFEGIKGYITTVLAIISNLIKAFCSLMKGDWRSALEYLKTAAKTAINWVVNCFKNLGSMLGGIFKDLIAKFKQWGKDMISNLVDGIKEKIDVVKNAAGNVAGTIKDFLHFSEPDVGPLSDFHTYAPDMMKLFAQGISDNAHLITDAVGSAFDLRPYINAVNSGIGKLTNVTSAGMEAKSAPAPVVVQVSLEGDANRLFRVLSEEAHRDWQITGTSKLMGY